MKRTIAGLLITMLCACGAMRPPQDKSANKSTDNKIADNQWVGHTIDELVVTIGEPSNIYMLEGGRRMFEYLQQNKTTTEAKSSLSAEAERARRVRAKRKELASDQYPNCKMLKILFKVSASDIIEAWSTMGEECK